MDNFYREQSRSKNRFVVVVVVVVVVLVSFLGSRLKRREVERQ